MIQVTHSFPIEPAIMAVTQAVVNAGQAADAAAEIDFIFRWLINGN